MGREDKATWKSNYFSKLVVSITPVIFNSRFFVKMMSIFRLSRAPIAMLALEIAEPTSMRGRVVDTFF